MLGSKLKDYPSRPARKYCSLACAAKGRMNRTHFQCAQCGRFAPRRHGNYLRKRFCSKDCEVASREGKGFLDKHGYKIIRMRGRDTPEHRIVMEGMIGRPMLPHETVHHKNGQRADNRPENLELWDTRNPKGQRVSDKLAWCATYLTDHGFHVTPPPSQA
ncbi:MAG: hypothetical protein E6J01_03970 [Chloroflexi bacterium]|nr:MAG: hypothetical protein E6J01_03970 [Chloroflexota bacterium]